MDDAIGKRFPRVQIRHPRPGENGNSSAGKRCRSIRKAGKLMTASPTQLVARTRMFSKEGTDTAFNY
jgi:hypothetical protein